MRNADRRSQFWALYVTRFAEGTDDGGVAASFGIRELVWRPGSVAGPLIAGWLMSK